MYFERSYYLVPDGRAEKPYALLVETMARTGKVAIGRFVLRTKQYLATLRAQDGVLVLSTMLYADEVIATDELEVPTAAATTPSDRELTMATQLVESLSAPFEPSKYHDDYREKVLALIEAKADGEIIAQPEPGADRAGRRPDGRPRGQPGRRPQALGVTPARRLRGHGRRPHPQAVQPGQGAVAGDRLHQGPDDRLLRPDRRRHGAPPAGPADHVAALPERRRRASFFEKNCPSHRPPWVDDRPHGRRHVLPARRAGHPGVDGQPGRHRAAPGLATGDRPGVAHLGGVRSRPRAAGADVLTCARVACWSGRPSTHLGLRLWRRRPGTKGLQLYVPLNTEVTYEQTRPFSLALAQVLERAHPDLVVTTQERSRPKESSSTGARTPSSRPRWPSTPCGPCPQPTVSTPVTWDELEEAVTRGDAARLVFETGRRCSTGFADHGDLHAAGRRASSQELPRLDAGDAPQNWRALEAPGYHRAGPLDGLPPAVPVGGRPVGSTTARGDQVSATSSSSVQVPMAMPAR